jgi:hypothetical protein
MWCNGIFLQNLYSSSPIDDLSKSVNPTVKTNITQRADMVSRTSRTSRTGMKASKALIYRWNIASPIFFSLPRIDYHPIVKDWASNRMIYFLQRRLLENVWNVSDVWEIALSRCATRLFCPDFHPVEKCTHQRTQMRMHKRFWTKRLFRRQNYDNMKSMKISNNVELKSLVCNCLVLYLRALWHAKISNRSR